MDVQKIKELALANGFSLKEQASIFENVTHWMPLPEAIEAQEPAND